MQKIMFLWQKELGKEYYRFEPADYGPFSWQLSNEVDHLVSSLYMSQRIKATPDGEKYEYALTKTGMETVKQGLTRGVWPLSAKMKKLMSDLKRENNRKNLKMLLLDVYSRYPEYASKSRVVF